MIQLGNPPPGLGCWVCGTRELVGRFYAGWFTFWLCYRHDPRLAPKAHAEAMSIPCEAGDPRPQIQAYIREGVSVTDKGLVTVEGFEHMGPAFVTEIKTLEGKFHAVCINPRLALGLSPQEFLLLRCRAVLDGIRKIVAKESPV